MVEIGWANVDAVAFDDPLRRREGRSRERRERDEGMAVKVGFLEGTALWASTPDVTNTWGNSMDICSGQRHVYTINSMRVS